MMMTAGLAKRPGVNARAVFRRREVVRRPGPIGGFVWSMCARIIPIGIIMLG